MHAEILLENTIMLGLASEHCMRIVWR